MKWLDSMKYKKEKTFRSTEIWYTEFNSEELYELEYGFSTEEDDSDSCSYVESPGFLRGVRGSLASERKNSRPKNFNKDLKLLKSLESQSRFYLSMEPEKFNIKLSEVTTSYPNLPGIGEVKIRGLHKLEGKGQARKWINLLIYLADWEDEFFYIHHYLLERIVSKLYNSTKDLEGTWLELRDLVSVYGKKEVRLSYISDRYSKAILNPMRKQGAQIAKTLYFSFVDTRVIQPSKRKCGYDDHGHLKLQHEYHGIPGKGEEEMNTKSRVDVQEKLFEIFKQSTENYLTWLQEQVSKVENSKINVKEEDTDEK